MNDENALTIIQPRWKEPEYNKRQINDAGMIVRNPNASESERKNALF